MHLVFNENTVYQQNATKIYRIQRLPNLKICWSVSMATKMKKKFQGHIPLLLVR